MASSTSAHHTTQPNDTEALIQLEGVSRRFGRKPDALARALIKLGMSKPPDVVHAVEDVDMAVRPGEVVGIVGESGCGKSTLGRMLAGLLPPSTGRISWNGQDIATLPDDERRRLALRIQMVFQNPFASINPRMRIVDVVGEAPLVHGMIDGRRGSEPYVAYVNSQLERVGLDPSMKDRYAHEFSGGQRQRIGIARALAVRPDVLVCDEAVAALDVSIQAQIINLFMDLKADLNLTYLFISHDLGVIRHLSDRVVVMYLGRVVEQAGVEDLFNRPHHPYTKALIDEIPVIASSQYRFTPLKGELPSPLNPPSGCAFHPRCQHAMARCRAERPLLRSVGPQQWSACHLD